jgi:hypothetical protein
VTCWTVRNFSPALPVTRAEITADRWRSFDATSYRLLHELICRGCLSRGQGEAAYGWLSGAASVTGSG